MYISESPRAITFDLYSEKFVVELDHHIAWILGKENKCTGDSEPGIGWKRRCSIVP